MTGALSQAPNPKQRSAIMYYYAVTTVYNGELEDIQVFTDEDKAKAYAQKQHDDGYFFVQITEGATS
jgi:hypothetical protein